jgi:hypothetical protein
MDGGAINPSEQGVKQGEIWQDRKDTYVYAVRQPGGAVYLSLSRECIPVTDRFAGSTLYLGRG